jgi:predicted PhzF superfamily epimerase YddE/YHI9
VRAVEVVLVDAFASTPSAGNPAAVVPDATGLDDAAMRAIAREMARPATAFTARATREPDSLTHTRNFIPHLGIPDPATGSSHVAIGVWLWETGILPADGGVARFRAEQGDFHGRPGRLTVEVHGASGRATRVRVGGQAVIVLTGALTLP